MGRYGLFSIAEFDYAISLVRLRKVIHHCSGYQLPKLPGAVAEVLIVDGQLIPLMTLGGMIDSADDLVRGAQYKVLAESEGGIIAFPADQTCGIVAEKKGSMLVSKQPSGVIGIFKYQGKEFNILDIDFLAIDMAQRSDEIA